MPEVVLVEGVQLQPPEHDTFARLMPRYVPAAQNVQGADPVAPRTVEYFPVSQFVQVEEPSDSV